MLHSYGRLISLTRSIQPFTHSAASIIASPRNFGITTYRQSSNEGNQIYMMSKKEASEWEAGFTKHVENEYLCALEPKIKLKKNQYLRSSGPGVSCKSRQVLWETKRDFHITSSDSRRCRLYMGLVPSPVGSQKEPDKQQPELSDGHQQDLNIESKEGHTLESGRTLHDQRKTDSNDESMDEKCNNGPGDKYASGEPENEYEGGKCGAEYPWDALEREYFGDESVSGQSGDESVSGESGDEYPWDTLEREYFGDESVSGQSGDEGRGGKSEDEHCSDGSEHENCNNESGDESVSGKSGDEGRGGKSEDEHCSDGSEHENCNNESGDESVGGQSGDEGRGAKSEDEHCSDGSELENCNTVSEPEDLFRNDETEKEYGNTESEVKYPYDETEKEEYYYTEPECSVTEPEDEDSSREFERDTRSKDFVKHIVHDWYNLREELETQLRKDHRRLKAVWYRRCEQLASSLQREVKEHRNLLAIASHLNSENMRLSGNFGLRGALAQIVYQAKLQGKVESFSDIEEALRQLERLPSFTRILRKEVKQRGLILKDVAACVPHLHSAIIEQGPENGSEDETVIISETGYSVNERAALVSLLKLQNAWPQPLPWSEK